MPDPVYLQVLGPPALLIGDKPVSTSPFQLALLSLFVLTGRDTVSRLETAQMLWPASSTASGRHSLSQVIYSLKEAVGGRRLIDGSPNELRLVAISSDIADIRQAIEDGEWNRAGSLYGGPLLQGLLLGRAPEFNDWVDSQRADFSKIAGEIVENLRVEGRLAQASRLAARIGAGAIVGGDSGSFAALDSDSLEGAPLLETDSNWETPFTEQTRPPFVGRREDLDRLEQLHARSITRGFTAVSVEGEPGIGKTALTDRFARLRALRGSRVLIARAFRAEHNVPFGIVAQWLRGLGQEHLTMLGDPWTQILTDAFPGIVTQGEQRRRASPNESEYRILEALRHLLLRVTEHQQLLLVLDDADLSDSASLSFVHYFSRRSAAAPVLFIATVRVHALLGNDPLLHWPEVHRIKVGPLPVRDIQILMSRLSGSSAMPAAAGAADLSRMAGGNPLLLVSLLTTSATETSPTVPDSVVEHFVPRLDGLSADSALLLAAISIVGDNIDVNVAAAIAGLAGTPAKMTAAMAELQASALIVVDGNGDGDGEVVAVKHGIVAEVAVAQLPAAARRALYGRAARTLAEEGRSPPAVIAVHHDIAGDRRDAFDTAVTAASASEALHASREREFFLKLALSNAPDPVSEARTRIELAEFLRQLGRALEALDVLDEGAMTVAPRHEQRRAHASRIMSQLAIDRAAANPATWDAIESLSDDLDPVISADLYFCYAAAAHDQGRVADTIAGAQRAYAISHNLPASRRSAVVAAKAALAVGVCSNPEEGLTAIRRLMDSSHSSLDALVACLSGKATLLVAAGRLIEAETEFLHCIELVERGCLYASLFGLHNNLGVCYMEQGKYDDAKRQLEEASRVGNELIGPSDAAIAADNLSLLHYERGEYEEALRYVREHPKAGDTRSSRTLYSQHAVMGLCALELGLLAKAFEVKRETELFFKHHEYWSNDVSYLETFLARMLVLEGKPEVARDRLETALEVYRDRDMMCQSRLELELARIDLKTGHGATIERAERMLERLRGSGARPLIERFEGLADRARLRTG